MLLACTHKVVELGDSAESNFDSIQFTIVASLWAEAIWSTLSNVLAKLLTVVSLGLAVNPQRRKYESKKHFVKHLF